MIHTRSVSKQNIMQLLHKSVSIRIYSIRNRIMGTDAYGRMNERMTEKKINLSFRQRNETIHDVVGCESIEHLEKSHSN